jgi:hypothetical protein
MKKIKNKMFNGGNPCEEITLQPTPKKASGHTTTNTNKNFIPNYSAWTFEQLQVECFRRGLL